MKSSGISSDGSPSSSSASSVSSSSRSYSSSLSSVDGSGLAAAWGAVASLKALIVIVSPE